MNILDCSNIKSYQCNLVFIVFLVWLYSDLALDHIYALPIFGVLVLLLQILYEKKPCFQFLYLVPKCHFEVGPMFFTYSIGFIFKRMSEGFWNWSGGLGSNTLPYNGLRRWCLLKSSTYQMWTMHYLCSLTCLLQQVPITRKKTKINDSKTNSFLSHLGHKRLI
jgi:hypothetical protein